MIAKEGWIFCFTLATTLEEAVGSRVYISLLWKTQKDVGIWKLGINISGFHFVSSWAARLGLLHKTNKWSLKCRQTCRIREGGEGCTKATQFTLGGSKELGQTALNIYLLLSWKWTSMTNHEIASFSFLGKGLLLLAAINIIC